MLVVNGQVARRYLSTRTSLVDATLQEMGNDPTLASTLKDLKTKGQRKLTLEERKKRRRSLSMTRVPSFWEFVTEQHNCTLTRLPTSIFQMNIGLYCNQACNHCHVESSPKRTEQMSLEIADRCLSIIKNSPSITSVDITGGAPELNPAFRHLVVESHKMGLEIIDRCNLTVLEEPGQEDLVQFLAEHKVRVVASLPCYSEKNVNMQRGQGVFGRSISGLQALNAAGYGKEGSELGLDLVFNPLKGVLPPDQSSLESDYKKKLMDDFGITFNSLFTLTNMPIKRFADLLFRTGELEAYMTLLVNNFNPAAVNGVMCRNTLSVSWDGSVYDCDFNQQLAISLGEISTDQRLDQEEGLNSSTASDSASARKFKSVFDIDSVDDILQEPIAVDLHCFGCTAGAGSSCQGTVA